DDSRDSCLLSQALSSIKWKHAVQSWGKAPPDPAIVLRAEQEKAEVGRAIQEIYHANVARFLSELDGERLLGVMDSGVNYDDINSMFLRGMLSELVEHRPPLPTEPFDRVNIYLLAHFMQTDEITLDEAREKVHRIAVLYNEASPLFDSIVNFGRQAYRTSESDLLIRCHEAARLRARRREGGSRSPLDATNSSKQGAPGADREVAAGGWPTTHRNALRREPSFAPATNEHDFDHMSVSEVIEWINQLPPKVPFATLSTGLRRLYDIAFFDHGIEEQDRTAAAQLVVVIKKSVEDLFANSPEQLAAFRKATEFTEGRIAKQGVNSLAWLVEEHNVQGEGLIPFIMRPEHGGGLTAFLELLGPEATMSAKSHMVRELTLQREGRAYPNTVLHLHGLVCGGDPAALAVFTEAEAAAFIRAPYDYQSTRQVLVELGMLPALSNALPLAPPPEDNLLKFIVSQTALDTLAETPPDVSEQVSPPVAGLESLDRIIPIALCIHLGLTMTESLYGPEKRLVAMDGIETQFLAAAEAGLLRLVGMMRNFEEFSMKKEEHRERNSTFSVDHMMIFAAWQEFNQWPEEEEQWQVLQPYLASLTKLLRHVRTDYLIRVRSYLRFFIHGQGPVGVPPSTAAAQIRKEFDRLYVEYGSRAGVAEAVTHGEDWIGSSP
ncbi:MAG: hypothetical protein WBZ54_03540, partial [Methylocella sp.]